MSNKKPNIIDRIANVLGYVKGVALTTSAVFGHREYPHPKTGNYLAAYSSWVFACVKARSRDIGRIELNLYRVNRKTGETEEVTDHDVLSLLRSVNPFMTMRQLIEYTQAYKDLTGEAFWYLDRTGTDGKGMITQIWLLRPDYVSVEPTEDGFIAGYKYSVPGNKPISLRTDQIIHHKEYNPLNPYRGMSIVRAAAVTIDSENYAEEYNKNFFRNSAVPEIVLSTEQKLSDTQVNRMHAEWRAKYAGTDNAHKLAILEGGLEVKPFSISQRDMEFLAGLGFSRDKILAMFEVPKSRLGMTEGVTVSNAEATINIYLKYLVKPLMEEISDTLTEFLLPLYKGTEDMFFDIEDPVPEDVKSELERMKTLSSIGALTPNEVRAEQGYDEVEGLDNFYLPINVAAIGGGDKEDEEGEDKDAMKIAEHKPTGRKTKLRVPAMRLRDKVAADVSEKVRDAVMSSIASLLPKIAAKKKEADPVSLGQSSWKQETKEAFWKQLIAKTDILEKKYHEKLVGFFDGQERQVLDALTTVEGKAIEKISSDDIERILISVTAENKVAADILVPLIKEILEESGSDTLDFLGEDTIAFDSATEAVKQFLREDALKGIRVMNKVTKSKLRKALREAVEQGLGPIETGRQIRNLFTEAKTVRALRVARTETLKAANRGALEAYKQSGVVAGKEWFTALDEGVCQWCGPLEGKVQGINQDFFNQGESYVGNKGGTIVFNLESIPTPPLHPNCRCTLAPITVSQRSKPAPVEKASTEDVEARVKEEAEKRAHEIVDKMLNDENA